MKQQMFSIAKTGITMNLVQELVLFLQRFGMVTMMKIVFLKKISTFQERCIKV